MNDLKVQIQSALNNSSTGSQFQNAKVLLNVLGYVSDRALSSRPIIWRENESDYSS